MSHDTEAAYASSEVADLIMINQNSYFGTMGTSGDWSVFAGREGGHRWPLADGVICAQNTTSTDVNIAFEFKRPNEGVHGILTALGQSYAYLEKGYDASVLEHISNELLMLLHPMFRLVFTHIPPLIYLQPVLFKES